MKEKFKNNRGLIEGLMVILFLVLLYSCGQKSGQHGHFDAKIMEEPVLKIYLNTVLAPTQSDVVSKIDVIKPTQMELVTTYQANGFFTYDTRQIATISARFGGRIEKLYVKYNFQHVIKGQQLMEIYSPELLTAQKNFIYLLQSDAENQEMIKIAERNLLLLGLTPGQVNNLVLTKKPIYSVVLFSPYSGHLHEIIKNMDASTISMNRDFTSPEFALKEGIYVSKGQNVFTIYDNSKIWAILNIYPSDIGRVKVGQDVELEVESSPDEKIYAKIDFIEPFYSDADKTARVRVYLDNPHHQYKINSLIKARISSGKQKGFWIPARAVYDLGNEKIVWLRLTNKSFKAHKIETGISSGKWVQVISGMGMNDFIAADAQYLTDSESFINISLHEK